MKTSTSLITTCCALIMFAASAAASVTFDPSTGTGFVGKGDLQTPWGWNNQKMQIEALNITFSYNSTDMSTAA